MKSIGFCQECKIKFKKRLTGRGFSLDLIKVKDVNELEIDTGYAEQKRFSAKSKL
jgi:hypothetical protein